MKGKSYLEILKISDTIEIKDPDKKFFLISDSEVTQFAKILKYKLYEESIFAEIEVADYGNIELALIEATTKENIDNIVLLLSTQRFKYEFYSAHLTAEIKWNKISESIKKITSLGKRVYLNTLADSSDRILGNYSRFTDRSINYQIEKFNLLLKENYLKIEGLNVYDLAYEASNVGLENWYDDGLWIHSKYHSHPKYYPNLAGNISKLVSASMGKQLKCIVLDLDNTLWGGVIGDDGIGGIDLGNNGIGEAFYLFQQYILQLKDNGYLLAIASKNFEEIALDAIKNHPFMLIKLDDIASYRINWNDKASNILSMAEELNIGLDSMIFLDDNPAEREIVKQRLPSVTIADLPTEVQHYIPYLNKNHFFEKTELTNEDKNRTKLYKNQIERKIQLNQTNSIDDYLKSLKMKAIVSKIDNESLDRCSQLLQRSNQFNLCTKRMSKNDIAQMLSEANKYYPFFVNLSDMFGEMGIVAVIILKLESKSVEIIEFVMSCRVLKRGVEDLIFEKIFSIANGKKVIGYYLVTPKNKLVKDLYRDNGFEYNQQNDCWEREKKWQPKHFIDRKRKTDGE